MRDLIDRKDLGAAIDNWLAIDRYYHPYSKQKTIPVSELVDIIKLLPSAQPNLQPTCNQLATDCISRQAAIEELQAWWDNPDDGRSSRQVMMQLPSAQRTGRWIVVSDGYGNGEATACICECSECKDTIWVYKKSDRKWNYCPNCGARMEAEE